MTPDQFRKQLTERASNVGLELSTIHLDQLSAYFTLLTHWNRTVRLTSLPLSTPSAATFERLFVEPLLVARRLEDVSLSWVDLGSGGGSPAIPIKVYRSHLSLTMVESRMRKAAFLREVVRTLGLAGAGVDHVRIEELSGRKELRGHNDLVTVRAVRIDGEVLDACRALLKVGGRLVLFGSQRLPAESGFSLISEPGLYERCPPRCST